jgi:hypothetical protein
LIADVEMYTPDAAPGKVDLVSVGVTSSDIDETIDFNVTLTDSDGDTVSGGFSVNVADGNSPSMALAATSLMAQEEQLQKSAANSNTLTMAAAVAAAGMAESAAASPPADDQSFQLEGEMSVTSQQVEMQLVDSGEESDSSISSLADTFEADTAATKSAGRGRGDEHRSDKSIDDGASKHSADDNSSHQAANDQGSAANDAVSHAVAPDVAMVSAEMLAAASLTGETGKHTGMVEEILVDALGQGEVPTVDGLLAQLPGGLGELAALSNAASLAAGGVPGWDMAMHGGGGFAANVLTKLDAAMLQHHDAVQPVING